ncbi:hypothetical protein WHK13_14320, partial [Staphylococcus aureus]|uniref:hypothetical protein n=1 Tax=Staphylococcus aureus TaxID=1280 RepID=UPI0039BE5AEF
IETLKQIIHGELEAIDDPEFNPSSAIVSNAVRVIQTNAAMSAIVTAYLRPIITVISPRPLPDPSKGE